MCISDTTCSECVELPNLACVETRVRRSHRKSSQIDDVGILVYARSSWQEYDVVVGEYLVARSTRHLVVVGLVVLWLACLGGGTASIPLALLWFAQCSLGVVIIRLILRRDEKVDELLLFVGPGYLLGYLTTTWSYMLLGGGFVAKASVYLCLVAAVAIFTIAYRQRLTTLNNQPITIVVMLSLVLSAMTWEFPELVASAVALVCLSLALASCRLGGKTQLLVVVACLVGFVVGLSRRSTYWFLESDDLANRMAEGILTVVRGNVASVGAYPFDRYHWVSPVGTALQAELAGTDLLFVFTIFSVFASLAMMMASLGILLQTFIRNSRFNLTFLLTGIVFALWWRMQVDTEASVGRLAILLTLMAIGGLLQQALRNSSQKLSDATTSVVFAVVLGAMLYLYRPDLVVLLLLLCVGVVTSLAKGSPAFRTLLLFVASLCALIAGLFAMNVILQQVSGSSLSYAQLMVDWRPPDLGWCTRGSALRDVMCVISTEIDLWATVLMGIVIIVLRFRDENRFHDLLALLFPAVPSYVVFRLTLTSDFPSSIEGFLQIGLLAGKVLALLLAAYLLSRFSVPRAWLTLTSAAIFAAVHINVRAITGAFLDDYVDGSFGRLQGIFTPSFLQWLVASAVLLPALIVAGRFVDRRVSLSHVVFLGFVAIGVWNLQFSRPFATDVNDSLVANVIGPNDVFDVGRWLNENTPSSALIATNYQCRPTEFVRCTSLERVGDGHPRATANWMLMAESRREFLYLSQPFYNPPDMRMLHEVSIAPGTQNIPEFDSLVKRGVNYYVACRECSSPQAWQQLTKRAVFSSRNFAVVKLD